MKVFKLAQTKLDPEFQFHYNFSATLTLIQAQTQDSNLIQIKMRLGVVGVTSGRFCSASLLAKSGSKTQARTILNSIWRQ